MTSFSVKNKYTGVVAILFSIMGYLAQPQATRWIVAAIFISISGSLFGTIADALIQVGIPA